MGRIINKNDNYILKVLYMVFKRTICSIFS